MPGVIPRARWDRLHPSGAVVPQRPLLAILETRKPIGITGYTETNSRKLKSEKWKRPGSESGVQAALTAAHKAPHDGRETAPTQNWLKDGRAVMTDMRDGWCLPSKTRKETTKHGAQRLARIQHQRCSHRQDGRLTIYDPARLASLYRNRAVYQFRQHTQTETRRCQGRGPAVPAGMVISLLLVRGFVVAA